MIIKNPVASSDDIEIKYNSSGTETDNEMSSLNDKMLFDLRNKLSRLLFQKEYSYTSVTKYLAHMYESIKDNQIIIDALERIKQMDEYTYTHSVNTAFYSMFIAIWMGLDDQGIMDATQAGLLHDIGKIYIPDEILNKAGKLEDEEYEIIKKHPLYGYFILNEFSEFNQEVKRAVLFHHERKNTMGYPLSAEPDVVGITSKIVAVADVYDAMTTERIYKKKANPLEVVEFFNKEGIKMFDNYVLYIFLQNIPVFGFKE